MMLIEQPMAPCRNLALRGTYLERKTEMKNLVVSLAVLTLTVGAAAAAGSTSGASVDLSNLSAEQLEALTNILTGLPRQ